MSDGQALLAAIIAAPDDDAPRLVYADWLDEHGEPERAEFIRVQCELARLPDGCPDHKKRWRRKKVGPDECHIIPCGRCTYCTLRRREQLLWFEDVSRFEVWGLPTPLVPALAHKQYKTYGLVARGFIDSLTCTAADCLVHLDAIRERHPVREVRLTTWPNETRAQYSHRWPAITFHLPPAEVNAIAFQRSQQFIRYIGTIGGTTATAPLDVTFRPNR